MVSPHALRRQEALSGDAPSNKAEPFDGVVQILAAWRKDGQDERRASVLISFLLFKESATSLHESLLDNEVSLGVTMNRTRGRAYIMDVAAVRDPLDIGHWILDRETFERPNISLGSQ